MKVGKMRLIIDEIRYEGNKIVVKGKTAIGEMKGVWKYTEPPVLGKGYHVELNINAPSEAELSSKMDTFPSVSINNEFVVFKGVCEGLDHEVYDLRFDVDWIEMLDIDVIAVKKQRGDCISFIADYCSVEIYPYTL